VASPEAAASILWRDSTRAQDAATNMKITAQDLLRLGIVDGIIPEPVGGAHRDAEGVVRDAGDVIVKAIASFDGLSADEIRKDRREKFLAMGRAS
jgi:acetyl-CoA carboxylase carboxyl transferase subunit alpha